MTIVDQVAPAAGPINGILDRERIIATAGFNRWLVPPAVLARSHSRARMEQAP
jgi:hypothetical protein